MSSHKSAEEFQQLNKDIARRSYSTDAVAGPKVVLIPPDWALLVVAMWAVLLVSAAGWTVAWALSSTTLWLVPAVVTLATAAATVRPLRALIAHVTARP